MFALVMITTALWINPYQVSSVIYVPDTKTCDIFLADKQTYESVEAISCDEIVRKLQEWGR